MVLPPGKPCSNPVAVAKAVFGGSSEPAARILVAWARGNDTGQEEIP
jgi:hypothetical protein